MRIQSGRALHGRRARAGWRLNLRRRRRPNQAGESQRAGRRAFCLNKRPAIPSARFICMSWRRSCHCASCGAPAGQPRRRPHAGTQSGRHEAPLRRAPWQPSATRGRRRKPRPAMRKRFWRRASRSIGAQGSVLSAQDSGLELGEFCLFNCCARSRHERLQVPLAEWLKLDAQLALWRQRKQISLLRAAARRHEGSSFAAARLRRRRRPAWRKARRSWPALVCDYKLCQQ